MAEQEYDKEQLRILRNAFKAFDHDEKGYIEYADVQQILEILGQKLDDKAVKNLIKEVDKSNAGKLDFNQFCKLAARFVEVEEDTTNLASELKEAFRVYDKEGKGYLTVQTLRDILHELDDKLSSQDLDMIIEEIDADGSGTVDFDEFMTVMTGKDMHDIIVNHRFVFNDPKPLPKCPCPGHRMMLHRRIESYFEQYFQNILDNSFNWFVVTRKSRPPSRLAINHHSTIHLPSNVSEANSFVSSHSIKSDVQLPASSTSSSVRISNVIKQPVQYCYRPTWRPRFPKWIPILTLYREALQNPLRRRVRYMITHN